MKQDLSLSIAVTAAATLLSLVAELWAASSVVDKPIADLGHADSSRLLSVS